jgi:iron complex transport system substrate-binding protein
MHLFAAPSLDTALRRGAGRLRARGKRRAECVARLGLASWGLFLPIFLPIFLPGRRLALWGVVVCAFGAFSATAMAAPTGSIEVQDERGTRHVFATPPARIVSLLPSLTETVCALQACERLVGVDRHANWPVAVTTLPRLGGLDDTPVERVMALRPDVVLAARSSRVVGRLEALGLKVLTFEPQDQAALRRTFVALALMLGRPEAGARLWAAMEAELDEAARGVPPALRGQRVYFEVNSAPYAAGAASFTGETLARLGLVNIVPAEMGAFPRLNPEFVVRAQPQVVLAEARALAAMPARPGWSRLAAPGVVRCGLAVDENDVLVRPGPRLGEGARLVVQCLQRAMREARGAARAPAP